MYGTKYLTRKYVKESGQRVSEWSWHYPLQASQITWMSPTKPYLSPLVRVESKPESACLIMFVPGGTEYQTHNDSLAR